MRARITSRTEQLVQWFQRVASAVSQSSAVRWFERSMLLGKPGVDREIGWSEPGAARSRRVCQWVAGWRAADQRWVADVEDARTADGRQLEAQATVRQG